jgi:hypothetical protein
LPTPDFSTISPPTSFTAGNQQAAPSLQEQLDPNSPFYNPFAAQVASMAPAPVQSFAKGGIATVAKFAKGGSADARLKAQAAAQLAAQRQQSAAAVEARRRAASQDTVSGVGYKAPTTTRPSNTKSSEQIERERYAAQMADAERYRTQLAAQQQEAARIAAQQAQQQEAARIAAQEAQRVAAEQAAAQEAARQAEATRISQGVADYRGMYAAGQTPTIEDQAIAFALEADRSVNPRAYMTPAQIQEMDAQQAYESELARIANERMLFDQQQAAIAAERARQEELARAAAELEAYKQSLTPPPAVSTAQVPNVVNPPTSVASTTVIPGGIGSMAPTTTEPAPATPVVNPFTPTPSPTYQIPLTESITTSPTYDFGMGNTSTSPTYGFGMEATSSPTYGFGMEATSSPTVGFAQGGIAAMAPSRFKSGGVMNFPRKTGPINGPGTATSDSIPAMLSDGEFVFTAKAVRNFGNGSRKEGAKKMYAMMKALERKA